MRNLTFLALVALALASSARGQVIYQTSFDDDSGWNFDPPNDQDTQWKVDGLPASTAFGAYRSPPSSLNYNNDVDYAGDDLSSFAGTNAYSNGIDLSVATGIPTLVFWCNNRMEEHVCDNHESVTVRVLHGPSGVVRCLTCGGCYQNQGTISPCNYAAWHEHVIPLDASWGIVSITFRFRGDAVANASEGYFVDDLSIVDVQPTTAYCTAKINSQGCAASMSTTGVPDLTAPAPFTIRATQVLNQKNGLLFYGLAGRHNAPFLGGTLCVKQPVRRTAIQSSGGNAPPDDCSGVLTFDFNSWAQSGADPALVAGAQVDAQYWYRDPADPFRTGLSNGVEFTLLP
jgi:hypothetical protein